MNYSCILQCGVCGKSSFETLWDLPAFPLTEKFGTYDPRKKLYSDQQLQICMCCGHVQLGMQISPNLLYTPSEYAFRTSQSKAGRTGAEIFFNFFHSIQEGKRFESLLDIGGNDLFLARMANVKNRCVVDPVCSSQDNQSIEGIKIIGKFIEDVDLRAENIVPDLIFCRHVLEHISNPLQLFSRLFEKCHPQALFVFEIPCLENLLEAHRLDAIFHQHYHYFDLLAFQQLISLSGGTYLAHTYNRQGSCGGALLIAFTPNQSQSPLSKSFPSLQKINQRKKIIKKTIQDYEKQMEVLANQLNKNKNNVYGYGASLMLATLAYHLKSDFSELKCILDDDPQKEGTSYQNVPVTIRYSKNIEIEKDSNFLITSLENVRSIYKRVTELTPRRILVPLVN